MKRIFPFIFVVLLFASLACSIGSLNFQDGDLQLEVSIREEQLNHGESRLDAGNLFSGSYQIDLLPGKAVITGTLVRPDGREIEGNVELGLSEADGNLQVNLMAVNAEGFSLQDEQILRLQETITKALSQAFNEQEVIKIESVTITDDAIYMTVRGDLSTGR